MVFFNYCVFQHGVQYTHHLLYFQFHTRYFCFRLFPQQQAECSLRGTSYIFMSYLDWICCLNVYNYHFSFVLLSQFVSTTRFGLYFRCLIQIRDFSRRFRGYRRHLSGYKNFRLAHSRFCKECTDKILKEKFYIDTREELYCISRHSYRNFLNYAIRKPANCLPSENWVFKYKLLHYTKSNGRLLSGQRSFVPVGVRTVHFVSKTWASRACFQAELTELLSPSLLY